MSDKQYKEYIDKLPGFYQTLIDKRVKKKLKKRFNTDTLEENKVSKKKNLN